MPVLNFVDREGDRHSAAAERGLSVMEVIRNSGRGDILALCGGMKSCATCHVYISEAWLIGWERSMTMRTTCSIRAASDGRRRA